MNGDAPWTDVGLALGLFGGGLASGLVPVVNAEAILAATVAGRPPAWMLLVLGLTSGQSTAKVLIYLTARDGPAGLQHLPQVRGGFRHHRSGTSSAGSRRAGTPRALRAGWAWSLQRLRTPVAGATVVATSALVGLPPLAVVSAMAGMARLRLALFVPACFVGRLARFTLIAWPVARLIEQGAPPR